MLEKDLTILIKLVIENDLVEDGQVMKLTLWIFIRLYLMNLNSGGKNGRMTKFRRCQNEEKEWVERPLTMDELEEAIKSFKGDKAPGPNDFNLYCFSNYVEV